MAPGDMTAELLSSVSRYEDIPAARTGEVCIIGRSNVGKSSFINHLFRDGRLAGVSKTPGKTRRIVFYRVSDGTIWADMPGYGYAKTSRGQRLKWAALIEQYCERRRNLSAAILLLDIRHPGLAGDVQASEYLRSLGIPFLAVVTKADKLSHNQARKNSARFKRLLRISPDPLCYSIHDAGARGRFWKTYREWRESLDREAGRA